MARTHTLLVSLVLAAAMGTPIKRGLGGLKTCNDAAALNLTDSWHYNWGSEPNPSSCAEPLAAEFVPMFWGCWGNCTKSFPADYQRVWRASGVRSLLGFNEPDNLSQSNLTPEAAAGFWPQLQEVANQFEPPLTLVSPAMTHWDSTGRSAWLDQFFSNCSVVPACDPAQIKYVAFHDYSGSLSSIISKANAAASLYGRKVWLTEFAVGSGKNRTVNDAFATEMLPALDQAASVARYAWFATRNEPGSWVAESSLLPHGPGADNVSLTPTSTGRIYMQRD